MPLIDLSTLDGPELRRLLDSARRQGQAAQSYEILQEMEARRHRGSRPKSLSLKRPARKPRTIDLALGDPLDPKEEPLLDPADEDVASLRLAEPPPRKRPPAPPPPAAKPKGWAHWGALIFSLGLAAGVAGGWWAADYANSGAPRPAVLPAPSAAPPIVQTSALAPALPPANAEPPVTLVPQAPVQAAQVTPPPAPPQESDAAPASPAPAAPAPAPAVQPAPPTPTAAPAAQIAETSPDDSAPAAKPARSASADDTACGSAPTPADRTICADPALRRLQGELREAYAQALKAHEDKALLRQRELAWADARKGVTDPDELARLYRERIGKLRAATAEALRLRDAAPVSPGTAARPAP